MKIINILQCHTKLILKNGYKLKELNLMYYKNIFLNWKYNVMNELNNLKNKKFKK